MLLITTVNIFTINQRLRTHVLIKISIGTNLQLVPHVLCLRVSFFYFFYEINDEMVEQMPGAVYTLTSVNTVGDKDNPTMFPPEFLNKLNPSGLPQHKLRLKINMVVILL